MKVLKYIIGILLLALAGYIGYKYYLEKTKEEPKKPTNDIEEKISNTESDVCALGYKCETIKGIEYKWTKKTEYSITSTYDYTNQELEAGKIYINKDGVLEFSNLKDKVLMKYDYLDGKVVSIEESIDSCEDGLIIVALTESGKIYYSDAHNGLLVDEAFLEMDSDYVYTDFYTKSNKVDYSCTVTEIYAKAKDGKVYRMLTNENVAQ